MSESINVLILEDSPNDAELNVIELRLAGFSPTWSRVDTEANYLAALEHMPEIILADFNMPQFDALRALHLLQERQLDIPFIVVTGDISNELSAECIKQGASDFLNKDRVAGGRLGQAVVRAMEQKRLRDDKKRAQEALEQANKELLAAYDKTIEGWSSFLDLRDHETEGHTQRVTEMTLTLARALGCGEDEIVHIRRGCLLHDIGKMGVADGILNKAGPLTDEEWVEMRKHPVHACERLMPISYLRPAIDIPYSHHEKWDGSGYPRGLKGEEIPLAARMFAIIDVWDALSSDRPYRKACSHVEVLRYIRQNSGSHFDPRIVAVFEKLIIGGEMGIQLPPEE